MRYEEGLFIGYKHYEKTGIAPLFPFGHGLSYTEFEWSQLQVLSSDDDAVIAEIAVTNIGARIGQEVVQLYVEDPAPLLPRPRRELKGFAKLTLKPGETQIARFELKPRDFACFDTEYRGWVARAGRFVLHVNVSAQTLKSSAEVRREKEWRELARKG